VPHPACRICTNQPTITPNSRQSSATALTHLPRSEGPRGRTSGIMQCSAHRPLLAAKSTSTPSSRWGGVGGGTGTLRFATTVEEGLEGVFEVAGLRVASEACSPKASPPSVVSGEPGSLFPRRQLDNQGLRYRFCGTLLTVLEFLRQLLIWTPG